LLDESAGKYAVASPKSDESSLLLSSQPTSDYSNVDAFFVIEAMVDLDDSVGIEAASSFLKIISSTPDSLHESKTVSLAARIVPVGESASPASQLLGSLFCAASHFNALDLIHVVDYMQESKEDIAINSNFFDKIESLSTSVRTKMIEVVSDGKKCHDVKHDEKYLYVANGRVYVPSSGSPFITLDDIKMLVNLELDKTIALTKMVLMNLSSKSATNDESLTRRVIHHAIGRSVAALNEVFSSTTKSESVSSALTAEFDSLQRDDGENPLYFSWNNDVATENLQVSVVPVAEI
jgi:hypothetical protein